ncbi:hypothetical protein F4778DRAFT_183042 [Xylariomycetidae sp. FL2044]|nr:hypothetical protein F4778DRAFT_183042 [Xylariomycetidae sp. FL2044]
MYTLYVVVVAGTDGQGQTWWCWIYPSNSLKRPMLLLLALLSLLLLLSVLHYYCTDDGLIMGRSGGHLAIHVPFLYIYTLTYV